MAEFKEKVLLNLPYSLRERVKEKAWRRGKSMNALLVQLIEDMLDGRLCLRNPQGERVPIGGVSDDPSEWAAERSRLTKKCGYRQNNQYPLEFSDDSDCVSGTGSVSSVAK
jgi:hypothetical protein